MCCEESSGPTANRVGYNPTSPPNWGAEPPDRGTGARVKPHTNPGVQRRFLIALALTALILMAEVVGGLWTRSLALVSDAAHVLLDLFAIALSYLALRLALPPDDRHTYGYHRLEVLAALANGLTLLAVAGGILRESFQRWRSPQAVRSLEMLVIAVIGLLVNVAVAFLLTAKAHSGTTQRIDLNVRSAALHAISDAVSSVGVIAAGAGDRLHRLATGGCPGRRADRRPHPLGRRARAAQLAAHPD